MTEVEDFGSFHHLYMLQNFLQEVWMTRHFPDAEVPDEWLGDKVSELQQWFLSLSESQKIDVFTMLFGIASDEIKKWEKFGE